MNKRKSVTQKDDFGCSIACVAFINGVTYKTAKIKWFKSKDAKTIGYFCRDVVRAFKLVNKNYGYKYVKRKLKFKENSIVFIKRSKRYPAGHYLAKTKEGWMDPWINFNTHKPDIKKAKAGFRKRLPGKPIYVIFPIKK